MTTIFKVEKRVIDEHTRVFPLGEWFFSTMDKADDFVNNAIKCDKDFCTKVADRKLDRCNADRVVKVFFGNEGYCNQYIIGKVNVL